MPTCFQFEFFYGKKSYCVWDYKKGVGGEVYWKKIVEESVNNV